MYNRPPALLPSKIHDDDINNQFALMTTNTDIFSTPISTSAPLSIFTRTTHEVKPVNVSNGSKPIGTNKFYANFMLDDQNTTLFLQPLSMWYSTDTNNEGLAVHHVLASDRTFGPDASANPVQYFFGPTGVRSIILGSEDFDSNTTLSVVNPKHLSAEVQIASKSEGYLSIPVIQGAGFITGVYYNLIPKLRTLIGFSSVTGDTSPRSGIQKYKITLTNGRIWTLYVTIPSGQSLTLALKDSNTISASNSVNGCIFQLLPSSSSAFDDAAGAYPTAATVSGSVSGTTGTYSINYTTAGSSNSGKVALFALPHHVESFTSDMSSYKTSLTLDTVTKGKATGYITTSFKSSLLVPSNIGLDPYSSISGASLSYSSNVLSQIKTAATADVANDVASQSNLNTMYYSGKILAKYAWVLYVTYYVLKDTTLTKTLLEKLKTAITRFSSNTQIYPLTYDQTWKGIISSASSSDDFGNSYYNDHHFHYGYHILAAAITAKVDTALGGTWVSSVKDWVNDLARDFANPNEDDSYFPAYRSFDWYNGHSWAKGIYSSGDGKDEESSSEDYNAYYGLKIWGNVIGDSALENRSNIQLGLLRVSLNKYFLLADDNTVQPSNFIKNKVTGILFENKIDHTTYFGTNLEYIQMIHAIPVTSISSFIRTPTFVQEEWDQKLSSVAPTLTSGWKGICYLNLALTNPSSSWSFFSSSSFLSSYLDDGQSKTWSLTYSGGFSGA